MTQRTEGTQIEPTPLSWKMGNFLSTSLYAVTGYTRSTVGHIQSFIKPSVALPALNYRDISYILVDMGEIASIKKNRKTASRTKYQLRYRPAFIFKLALLLYLSFVLFILVQVEYEIITKPQLQDEYSYILNNNSPYVYGFVVCILSIFTVLLAKSMKQHVQSLFQKFKKILMKLKQ